MVDIVQPFVPLMTISRFAELVGLSTGQVQGFVNKGYIHTFKIGKHRMVNVAALTREVMAEIEGEL